MTIFTIGKSVYKAAVSVIKKGTTISSKRVILDLVKYRMKRKKFITMVVFWEIIE